MFEYTKQGCIEAKKWLIRENLYHICEAPANCDGFSLIDCANIAKEKQEESGYYCFAKVRCRIRDLINVLDERCISKDDLDTLDDLIGDMVESFTKDIINLETNIGDFEK